MDLRPFDLFLGFVLIVGLPLWAMRRFRGLRSAVAREVPGARVRAYRTVLLVQWPLVALVLVHWLLLGRDLTHIGFALRTHTPTLGALLIAAAGTVMLLLQLRMVRASDERMVQARVEIGELGVLLPHTPEESRWFGAVAVTAGVCEEILYRGYLPWLFLAFTTHGPAVALSVLVFGLGHSYQGIGGVIKTTFLGAILALMTVLSGSLLPAILLHTAIDLINGRLAYHVLSHVDGPRTRVDSRQD